MPTGPSLVALFKDGPQNVLAVLELTNKVSLVMMPTVAKPVLLPPF